MRRRRSGRRAFPGPPSHVGGPSKARHEPGTEPDQGSGRAVPGGGRRPVPVRPRHRPPGRRQPPAERLTGLSRRAGRPADDPLVPLRRQGRPRLSQAGSHSEVFHSQEGFLLRRPRTTNGSPSTSPSPGCTSSRRRWRSSRPATSANTARPRLSSRPRRRSCGACWPRCRIACGARKSMSRAAGRTGSCRRSWRASPAGLRRRSSRRGGGVARRRPPEDRPRWDEALARLRAGRPSQEEYRVVLPDGLFRWVRDSVTPTPGRAPHPAARRRADRPDRAQGRGGGAGPGTPPAAHPDGQPARRHLLQGPRKPLPGHQRRPGEAARSASTRPRPRARPTSTTSRANTPSRPSATSSEVIATGKPIVNLEEKETWPDGSETWVSTTKMPMRDAGPHRRHVRRIPRHHGAQEGGEELQQGQGGGGGGQPGQERVPGQHEPRDPHADERHPRHDRAGAGHRPDARAARVPGAW